MNVSNLHQLVKGHVLALLMNSHCDSFTFHAAATYYYQEYIIEKEGEYPTPYATVQTRCG